MLVIASPGGIELFFRDLGEAKSAVGSGGTEDQGPAIARMTEVAARYGIEVTGPPA